MELATAPCDREQPNAMGFGGGGPGSNLGGELLCRGVPQLSKFELHTDAVATSKLSY